MVEVMGFELATFPVVAGIRLRSFGLVGGADGIRTHDLLDAIEARSQLRHGPTELQSVFMLAHMVSLFLSALLPSLQKFVPLSLRQGPQVRQERPLQTR